MNPGDIVTIGPPFGANDIEYVVVRVLDDETVTLYENGIEVAYSKTYLTSTGRTTEVPEIMANQDIGQQQPSAADRLLDAWNEALAADQLTVARMLADNWALLEQIRMSYGGQDA